MGWKDEATEALDLWTSKDGREWQLTFQLAEIASRLECVAFGIQPWPAGAAPAPLYAKTLHELPFGLQLTRARQAAAQRLRDSAASWPRLADRPGSKLRLDGLTAMVLAAGDKVEAARLDTPGPKGGRHAKYTTADLERVAAVYRDAYANCEPPAKAVAADLGVSDVQARKLVWRCRKLELLPLAEGDGIAGWARPAGEEETS